MNAKVYIHNGAQLLAPAVQQGVEWITERKGVPGKLTFSALRDSLLDVSEGNPVSLHVDGKPAFKGFIFRISGDKGPLVKITAYDQMRYLKNKDTYVFDPAKASEIIRMIAEDYGLELGEIADTGYTIPGRVEDNTTLLDMMQTALELTLTNTRNLYVLYDDAGKLTLKNAADMYIGLLLDEQSAENYSHDTSIDEETYNRVKLVYEDEKSGKRKVYISEDAENQKKWGTLQLFESISGKENAQSKADMLLKLYNTPKGSLKISGALGDMRVRAGCFAMVKLADAGADNFMLVESCRHRFENGRHSMDLTLKGGDFSG
ncbi:MAG: hydrolase [Clostridia bacterium]|nr:hydrolase [Clostridia bacterium]